MESFYTLQGEGFHSGRPAWFIRTGGCDVGCHWCDVKESWDASAHGMRSVAGLMEELRHAPVQLVVVTGGEPLMHNMEPLTRAIRAEGLQTHLETSGAYPLSGQWDWICFSPKKFKAPLPSVAAQAHELKVVIYNRHDFEWAEQHAQMVSQDCKLFLQPEWGRAKQITPVIIDYVKAHPRWSVSLQTHKYLNIP